MRLIGSFFLASAITLVVSAIIYALCWLATHFGIIPAIIGAIIIILTVVLYIMLDD